MNDFFRARGSWASKTLEQKAMVVLVVLSMIDVGRSFFHGSGFSLRGVVLCHHAKPSARIIIYFCINHALVSRLVTQKTTPQTVIRWWFCLQHSCVDLYEWSRVAVDCECMYVCMVYVRTYTPQSTATARIAK